MRWLIGHLARLSGGQLLVCGVVRPEVLRGIRSVVVRDELSELFDLMTDVPTDMRVWRKATDLAWTLDRRGAVLPLTDLLIASCALVAGATVVTNDPHFWQIRA